jgi:hypothetical protein
MTSDRRKRLSVSLGLLAGIVCIIAAVAKPDWFWPAYLVGVVFTLGIGLGSLGIALLHQLTGGRWGWAILRELVATAQTVPVSIILLVPLAFGSRYLYPWLRDEAYFHELPPSQQLYFEPAFWMGRALGYFAIWILLTFFVQRSYRAASKADQPDRWHATARLSAWGLIVLWFSATFAAFDWMMALEPAWLSTIYGAIVMMGFAVSGLAFQLLIRPAMRPAIDSESPDQTTADLATLLLAFLLVWVYFAFSQFFIIWHGDLPVEGAWYHRRSVGVWGVIGTLLLVLHFALPFALLLSRDLKRRPKAVAGVAAGLLLMRLVDLAWHVLPAFDERHAAWLLLVPVAALAAGGLCLAGLLRFHERLPDLHYVPSVEESHAAEPREALS